VRITDVLASRDLSSAKVFYTVPEEQKDMEIMEEK
jgi:ribosome-binding factor A